MKLRVALQIDHPTTLNPRGDSTLVMAREAQRRGYELFFYTPDNLTLQGASITAHGHPITLHENPDHFYDLGEPMRLDLSTMHVVLLRQDPPFNMAYLTSTYLLDMLPATTLVVNNPTSVRNYPEKLMPLRWAHFMPPTLVSSDLAEIEAFRREQGEIILKPLYGYGGRAILHLRKDDGNLPALMEMHLQTSKEPLMAQRFLPEVKTEDRRIVLIDGDIAGAIGRIPAQHEIRANLRVGGTAAKVELTKRQHEICEALKPFLKEKGLLFVGLDTIGDYLTEINVTSPTGLVSINTLYNKTLEVDIWNAIESKL